MTHEPMHVVALSGGKDSTAMALRLAELHPSVDYVYLCTPTGDELPELVEHWATLEGLLGKPLTRITNGSLRSWIAHHQALPSWRMRWCTRVLKIEPCIAFFKTLPTGSILYVGLRADEEAREGIVSRGVPTKFPMREWGWSEGDVRAYLRDRCVKIPARTDCARCYDQRLSEWYALWQKHPDIYADAVGDEARTGHTFRSAGRDSWPAGLAELAVRFAAGHKPRGITDQLDLFDDEPQSCRICRL